MVDVGDAACDRSLDRDHAERSRSFRDGREGVLERRAGQWLPVGKHIAAGDVRIGARLALIGDFLRRGHVQVLRLT